MTHPDAQRAFEEMMPEPAFAPTEGLLAGMPLYTADQLRTAMQAVWDAATEREAKVVEQVGPSEGSLKLVTEGLAAAIRGATT